MMTSFQDVIDLWASPDALARDIGARVEAVRKWRQRNSIPADWWLTVVSASESLPDDKTRVTVEVLAEIAAHRREALPVEAAG